MRALQSPRVACFDPRLQVKAKYGMPAMAEYMIDVYFDKSMSTAYPLILDSGSANTAVVTNECTDCGHSSSDLTMNKAKPHKCMIITYGDGSGLRGYETERSFVGLSAAVHATAAYAGITNQSGSFFFGTSDGDDDGANADFKNYGILGTAFKGLSEDYYSQRCLNDHPEHRKYVSRNNPLLYALKTQGALDANVHTVSICDTTAKVGLGGVAPAVYGGPMHYAPVQRLFNQPTFPSMFYQVRPRHPPPVRPSLAAPEGWLAARAFGCGRATQALMSNLTCCVGRVRVMLRFRCTPSRRG